MRYAGRVVSGFLILTTLVAAAESVRAEGVRWLTDPQAAVQQAASANRPLLIKFTADWCGHCRRMDRTTFAEPETVETVHSSFVPLLIDTEKHPQLAKELKITGLPALLIVAPDLTILDRIKGFQTSARLLPRLNAAVASRPAARFPALPAAQQRTTEEPAVDQPMPTDPFESEPPNESESFESNPFESEPPSESEPPNPFAELELPQAPVAATSVPAASTDVAQDLFAPLDPVRPAFDGLCLTSVIDERKLTEGSADFAADYRGHRLHFRDAGQRDTFFETPEKYWPMLDGVCAATLLQSGQKIQGKLRHAAVFRDRIWLFDSRELMEQFIAAPARMARRIEENRKLTKTADRSY